MTTTLGDLLRARTGDHSDGLLFEGQRWSWDAAVRECEIRASVMRQLLDGASTPHVGVLLDNVPEFAFLLGGAALGGHVVVGLNTTRRGPGLAADVHRAQVAVVLTEDRYLPLLEGADLGDVWVLSIDAPRWAELVLTHTDTPPPVHRADPGDLFMLIFTSGTSGEPKAVRVTDEKVTIPGLMLADRFGLTGDDVTYLSMPLFHSNAVMAGWGPALAGGTTMALTRKFSASRFLPEIREYGATYANYVGKPLTYVMATPERPDDADNPLRVVFGNEANERDIEAFARRFGCVVIDSYGSTENAVIVQRVDDMPPGALGVPLPGVEVLDPTGARCPVAEFGPSGELLNADEATGELVNTEGAGFFAGYYNDPAADAARMRDGMYWSGDLAYRDKDGFVYFAGRTSDWLRVDGENLGAAPIERILLRSPVISQAAVYAVPDRSVGDQVMAAVVLEAGAVLDPEELTAFLAAQPDLGPKMWPRYVRVCTALPSTATNKVLKRTLAAQAVDVGSDPLLVREPRGTSYEPA